MFSGCCGQPSSRKRTTKEPQERLPANPEIKGGVRLLYLGAGRRDLKGETTGVLYVVSDHRRSFIVHADDVRSLLRNRFVIPAP